MKNAQTLLYTLNTNWIFVKSEFVLKLSFPLTVEFTDVCIRQCQPLGLCSGFGDAFHSDNNHFKPSVYGEGLGVYFLKI